MAEVAARGAAVDVSGTARDVALEDNVSGRLDGSVARLDEYGHSMRATLLGDRRQADSLGATAERSEEHTSELQSLMRISYAVFCLKKKKRTDRKYKYNEMISTHKKIE